MSVPRPKRPPKMKIHKKQLSKNCAGMAIESSKNSFTSPPPIPLMANSVPKNRKEIPNAKRFCNKFSVLKNPKTRKKTIPIRGIQFGIFLVLKSDAAAMNNSINSTPELQRGN